MTTTPPPVIRITEQEALNAEAGWLPIASEPILNAPRRRFLVTVDPTDPHSVYLVSKGPYGNQHWSGDDCIEEMHGTGPTHWMPVLVAKKAGA